MVKQVLMVIAESNFRDEEYFHPKQVLTNRGFRVVTASSKKEAASKFGQRVSADVLVVDANPDLYDAVVFVGGGGAEQYFKDHKALALAKAFFEAGKPTTAICIAPSILANAGILKGKRATCFESEIENLKAHGAAYSGEPVTVEGTVATANGPKAAKDFGEAVARLLA